MTLAPQPLLVPPAFRTQGGSPSLCDLYHAKWSVHVHSNPIFQLCLFFIYNALPHTPDPPHFHIASCWPLYLEDHLWPLKLFFLLILNLNITFVKPFLCALIALVHLIRESPVMLYFSDQIISSLRAMFVSYSFFYF